VFASLQTVCFFGRGAPGGSLPLHRIDHIPCLLLPNSTTTPFETVAGVEQSPANTSQKRMSVETLLMKPACALEKHTHITKAQTIKVRTPLFIEDFLPFESRVWFLVSAAAEE
jgi:hypothetical protein